MQRELALGACGAMVLGVAMLTAETGQDTGIDRALARQYFEEAQQLCREDGGRLWGRTLCGPLLFVSSNTLEAVASEADPEGRLREAGDVWAGRLDPGMTPANTALDWAGRRWTQLLWPLPQDAVERRALLMHESWHRIQDDLGFPFSLDVADHLDSSGQFLDRLGH